MPRRESRRQQVLPPVRRRPVERAGDCSRAVPGPWRRYGHGASPRCAPAHVADALGVYRRRRAFRDRAARGHRSRSIPRLQGAGRRSKRPRGRAATYAGVPSHVSTGSTQRAVNVTAGANCPATGRAGASSTDGNHTASGASPAHDPTPRARPAAVDDAGARPGTRACAADTGWSAANASGARAAAGGTTGPQPATTAGGISATSAAGEPATVPAALPGGDADVPGSRRRVYR